MKSFYLIRPYFIENRRVILYGLLSLIGVDMLQLFIPRIIKWAVDDLTTLQIDIRQLVFYALYIVLAAVLTGVFRYIWRHCLIGMSRRVEEGLRNRLFNHIQTLSANYFSRMKTGDIMAHATNDIANVRMAAGMGMVALTDAVFLGGSAMVFMAYINLRLTLLALIPMPLIVLCTRFFSKIMHTRYREVQGAFSDLTEVVRERFAGIRIIKAFNMQESETARLNEKSRDYIRKNLGLVKITGSLFPMMVLFTNISLAVVLYLGGRQTITATITAGDFVAFINYLALMTWPMMALGWVVNLIQRGGASLDRINQILQATSEIRDREGALRIQSIKGDIAFETVSFAYSPAGPLILSGVDFSLRAGKVLGITGPPGSGKTTLLNLFPRLFDARQGRILIDGVDIRRMKIRDLRSQIAFVPQEPFLFSGTIRENITFQSRATSDEEEDRLIRAVKEAALYETVMSFPQGLETLVGERGVILSGGQKQRVALARALMCQAPLLIMDDPISQVDMQTGAEIIATIRSLTRYKTVIIVSHRFSAIQFADRILVLQDGKITESGTHAELMAADRYYAKTFRLQTVEEGFNAG